MKRLFIAVLLAASALAAYALATPRIGSIDYLEGDVSISRGGTLISGPAIGDSIASGDLIKTSSEGSLIIAMDKNTGMQGTIAVRPRSSLYINLDTVKGEPRTRIDILTGAIGSKVAKLAGSPTMGVSSSSATMSVRGTEFEVAVSVNADDSSADARQAVLVTCSESAVAVNDGDEEVEVAAGKVLEKRPGEKFRFIPVAESSVKGYTERWIADEITAFKANAPRALENYAKRYADLSARFAAAYDPFQRSQTPKKWADEDRRGVKANPLDAAVLKEKKEIAGYLVEIKKILFSFERVYSRIDEIADLIQGSADEKRLVKPGLTAGDLVKIIKAERETLASQVAKYHYIEALYRERSPDGDAFANNDDFFSSSDGF
jgi:FecR protein.